MRTLTLNNGVVMPRLGFGVGRVPADGAGPAVAAALAAGYRCLDTASRYGNEESVGRAVRASGVPRAEVFVTTKVWNDDHGYDEALRAFDASADRLGLGHVDLYLIHWPCPGRDMYVKTWHALESLYAEGRVRAIGVSNFTAGAIGRLAAESDVVPAVNQVELHPNLAQADLRAFHAERGIATMAYSPLGRGRDLLRDPTLEGLAAKHGRTTAQIVLRWHLQLGNAAIPKSVTPSRVRENADVFRFELDAEDMEFMAGMDTGSRLGADPDASF
ncbi:aldo/keto reductase [Planotetraspora silvatica]|uniref:aldo/keto reductase n=1 Tax=Planotetraspora silvatica TaxID=234614 RepID=UPI00357176DD